MWQNISGHLIPSWENLQRVKYGRHFEELQQQLHAGQNGTLEAMQSMHDAMEAMIHETKGELSSSL